MKKIATIVACAVIALSTAGISHAQNNQNNSRRNYTGTYNHAIGLRLGPGGSITYKQRVGGIRSFEVLADVYFADPTGIYLTGLYEWNHPVFADGFNFYYGVGAHIGVLGKEFAIGVDGIVGLEYLFPRAPIALSLDWKPQVNFMPDVAFNPLGFALGIKYVF